MTGPDGNLWVLASPGDGGKVNASNGGHVELVWTTSRSWAGTCRRLVLGFSPEGWNTASAMFVVWFSSRYPIRVTVGR